MTGVPRYDRFMVLNKIGAVTVLRRYFTPEERWCWVAGVLGTAADSPIRGWLLLTEQMPASADDIADAAGVTTRVATKTLEKAVKYGLVEHEPEVDCLWVPEFEIYNPARAGTADRNATRRQQLRRDPELRAEIRARDEDLCRYCGKDVEWKNRRGPAGGTYDHVDPCGSNTSENLVVACRGCNSSKKDRTPEEAGMPLLAPGSRSGLKSDLDPDLSRGSGPIKEVRKEVRKEERQEEVPPAVIDARESRLGETVQQVLRILRGSSRLHVDDIATPRQVMSAIDAYPQASAIPAAHEAVCWAEDPTWRGTDGGNVFLTALRKQDKRAQTGGLRVAGESKAARRIRELQDQIDALPAEDAA